MMHATSHAVHRAVRVNRGIAAPSQPRGRWAIVWVLLCALHVLRATVAASEEKGTSASEGSIPTGDATSQGQPPARKPPTFADDTLMYVFGPSYRNPYTTTPEEPDGADIARHAIEFKHIDTWRYGHNLIDVIIKKSSEVEPAAGGGTGVLALYGIFRSGIGLNRVTGSRVLAIGPLRDVAVEVGVNLETKNSDYAPEERTLYFGPNLQLRFWSGFLNVGLHLRKEWNHNGHLGVNESYDTDFNIEPVWHFPFRVGAARLAFDGFADLNTPKGKDSSGHDTHTEIIIRPQLKLDISRIVGQKQRVLEMGIGFQYYRNMFGKSADVVPGANELTPIVTLSVHLPMGRSAD
jgi:nucleoside-specific outer membrane channel protein Tsx